MDEFDQFNVVNQTTDLENQTNVDQQEEDLLGSNFTTNNRLDSESKTQQQQPDLSWITDDNLPEATPVTTTTTQKNIFDVDVEENPPSNSFAYDLPEATPATTTTQKNIFDVDVEENPPSTSFAYDLPVNQSTTQSVPSYPTWNPSLVATNELSYDDSDRQPSRNNSSYDLYSDAIPSSSSMTAMNSSVPRDNLSALHAFNARRQEEIAEMDAIEKQKIDELRREAKKDLEEWYEERRTRMEQKRQSVRQEQDDSLTQALQKSDKKTCDWAKVIRLLDFSQGTQVTKQKRDINRMRAVIIQAKRDKDGQKSENGV